jgi:hypothetical protein
LGKALALIHGVIDRSCRKTAERNNRVRHHLGATPSRTLRKAARAEGAKVEQVPRKAAMAGSARFERTSRRGA